MVVYAYMEHGTGKQFSEDTMLADNHLLKDGLFVSEKAGNCVAIADGVGGNAGGKEASEFVLEHLNEISDYTRDAIMQLNSDLIRYSKSVPGKEKMATTLSAIQFDCEAPKTIVHVGNTRIYAIQGEYLKQLTKDHTTVELLRQRGAYDAAENAPSNEITSCMGAGSPAMINQLQVIDIDKEYSGYVLTSDGIHDHLDEEALEDFIANNDYSESAFEDLTNQATEKGSADDKSIIIIKLWEK